jgi:hypothetical protein
MLASRSPARPRRLLAALAALLAIGAGAGTAIAADGATAPSAHWPSDGPAIRTAVDVAAAYWGSVPCRGRVDIGWDTLSRGVNATSSWANDVDPYTQPSLNTECDIVLSVKADWDWPMLCSVIVHEVGHLTGHDHVDDPADIMYPTYVAPIPDCMNTPEPADVATAATAPRTAPQPTGLARATQAKTAKPRKAVRRSPRHGAKAVRSARGRVAARGH